MRNYTLVMLFFGFPWGFLEFFLPLYTFGISSVYAASSVPAIAPYIVVIDPGHGGEDVGSIARIATLSGPHAAVVYEKDITLRLSRRISQVLREPKFRKSVRRPIRVVLTRNRDLSLSLDSRARIARTFKTDLFLSIHLNSENTGTARGVETYFLNNTTSETDSHQEKLYRRRHHSAMSGNSDLSLLLQSVASDSMVSVSYKAADTIQKAIVRQALHDKIGLENRGVRQSLLQVLLDARVPAVLVEGFFLSNPNDLRLARNPKAIDSLARGIAQGVVDFLGEKE